MTLILKQLFAFIKLLNSDVGSNQIAAGIAAGLVLGFSPILSLQTLVVFTTVFVFRVQIGAAFLAAFFFKFTAYLLDPVCEPIGAAILEASSLQATFTSLYNMPLVPLTRFNNSVVMGSAAVSFALVIPTFFIAKFLIAKYREKILARFHRTKAWKAVKATAFYKWYATYEQYR